MEYEIEPSTCLIFFGIRYLTAEKVDKQADPRIQKAKAHDLSVWSGRRYPPGPSDEPGYFLLIGDYWSTFGYDGSCERSISEAPLRQAAQTTAERLAQAGFTETPELWMQCKYD